MIRPLKRQDGQGGQGTLGGYFPRIAGKPAGYLYNQLIAFRDGRRRYPPMNYLLDFLPDAYLQKMAEHFASLRPPFPALHEAFADWLTATPISGRC
jgi:cytochrome c553